MGQDSHDITKSVKDQAAGAGRTAMRGKHMAKLAKAGSKLALKMMKFIISKIIIGSIKAIVALVGPYIAIGLLLIILLLLVVDSINVFDIFQRGGEREPAEELFDETILNVMKTRSDDTTGDITSSLRGSQAATPYPEVSEAWLKQAADQMEISYALPAILHYYKNLKNENYDPWHSDYKDRDISTPEKERVVQEEFTDIIWQEYDYYFQDSNMQPVYTYVSAPAEYKEVSTYERCEKPAESSEDPEEPTPPPTITEKRGKKKTELPGREIVSSVNLLYYTGTVSYKSYESGWSKEKVTKKGDCTIKTKERYFLHVIDDQMPLMVEFSPTTLVSFLTNTAPEGELTERVKPVDLKYALALGEEVDDSFPTVSIDFAGFLKCAEEKDISACVGEFVLGGTAGAVGGGGVWYPEQYKELYIKAGKAYDVDWWIIASIHGQETTFSANPAASDPKKGSLGPNGELVGAVGHFQFMPLTWAGWGLKNDPKFKTTSKGNLIGDLSIIMDLNVIKKYGGFGVDADKDNKASPWDIEDAAYTAAHYLKKSGYKKGNEEAIKKAIRAYNHSNVYVAEVWARGILFRDGPTGGVAAIPVATGSFTYPTTGKITSPYGMRVIYGQSEFHYGIDVGGGGRTFRVPIVSVAAGIVTRAKVTGSYGWVVFVKHQVDGKPFETVYAHLDGRPPVNVGQEVQKGQTIGYMGSTGRSTGKHLHFEIHTPYYISQAKTSLNPANYIPVPPIQ